MRGPSPLYIEERHRALGPDATFSWSRALTHPPRCNRTRHRGRHLDFVGAADRKSWGPPSLTGSDVKNAKPAPILLLYLVPRYFDEGVPTPIVIMYGSIWIKILILMLGIFTILHSCTCERNPGKVEDTKKEYCSFFYNRRPKPQPGLKVILASYKGHHLCNLPNYKTM